MYQNSLCEKVTMNYENINFSICWYEIQDYQYIEWVFWDIREKKKIHSFITERKLS